eukprot:jgi/Botrbrau1/10349/Bobra.0321s0024.1
MHIGLSVIFFKGLVMLGGGQGPSCRYGAMGSIGGAYVISSPSVPGHAHLKLFLRLPIRAARRQPRAVKKP